MVREDPVAALPRVLAQAWGLAQRPRRGPKPELSLDIIVRQAIGIADAEGLDAVTMARVARELGFTTMSLYRHVSGKDDLLGLMHDAAADFDLPAEQDEAGLGWRAALASWTRTIRRFYLRHSWALEVPVSGTPSMPNAVRIADWALRGMRNLPITDGERVALLLTLNTLAQSFARLEVELVRAVQLHGPEEVAGSGLDDALAQVITAERFPDLHRLITAGAYFGGEDHFASARDPRSEDDADGPVGEEFEYALALVLDGVTARIERSPQVPAPH